MVLAELSNDSRVPIAHREQLPKTHYKGDLLTCIGKLFTWFWPRTMSEYANLTPITCSDRCNYSYLGLRLTRINHPIAELPSRVSAHRLGSANYCLEITRSRVALRSLRQSSVTHFLGFKSSSTY